MRKLLLAALTACFLSAPVAAAPIARISAAEGLVEIQRNGRWRKAREGTELTIKDSIRTGPDALAQVEFYDADAESGAQATTIDLVPESEIAIEHFEISKKLPRTRQGFIDVARGYLRTFTKGWASGSIFSVKAGTTVCGIRGSIADIGFDPQTGEATFTSLDGKMFTFQAGALPDNYNSMTPAQKKATFKALVTAAIRKALEFGRDLEAGRSITGAREMTPSERLIAQSNGDRQVITLTQEQRTRLLVASAKKGGPIAVLREINRLNSGTNDTESRSRALQMINELNRPTTKTSDQIIDDLTQELSSSPELNAPTSKN
jgi:hypothetical protein